MLQKLFNPDWQITSKSFLLSSFLIGFSFSPTAEISSLELEFEESLPRKPRQREDWTGVKWSSQSRKTHFLTLPDLAFGFVHKRSGNEIILLLQSMRHRARYSGGKFPLFARLVLSTLTLKCLNRSKIRRKPTSC